MISHQQFCIYSACFNSNLHYRLTVLLILKIFLLCAYFSTFSPILDHKSLRDSICTSDKKYSDITFRTFGYYIYKVPKWVILFYSGASHSQGTDALGCPMWGHNQGSPGHLSKGARVQLGLGASCVSHLLSLWLFLSLSLLWLSASLCRCVVYYLLYSVH